MNDIPPLEREVIVRTYCHVNGAPIRMYDENIDRFITVGEHPTLGLHYYVVTTSKYLVRPRVIFKNGSLHIVSSSLSAAARELVDRHTEYVSVDEFDKMPGLMYQACSINNNGDVTLPHAHAHTFIPGEIAE